MSSINKKNKGKNSYLHARGEKCDCKLKRIMYFTKRQRNRNKHFEMEG